MANAMPIAYVDSICKPHEKLLCMTFIWVPYGFAIGIIGNLIVKKINNTDVSCIISTGDFNLRELSFLLGNVGY